MTLNNYSKLIIKPGVSQPQAGLCLVSSMAFVQEAGYVLARPFLLLL